MLELIQSLTVGQAITTVVLVLFSGWFAGSLIYNFVRARQRPRELARIAAHFGMRPARDEVPLQKIKGRVQGYLVTATWRQGTKIQVDLLRPSGCELGTDPFPGRPPEGMATFDFPDHRWNALFQRRFATLEIARWWSAQRQPDTALGRFVRRWGREVRPRRDNRCGFTIEAGSIQCSLGRGSHEKDRWRSNFLLFADASVLIPDLIAIARSLDTEAPTENRPLRPLPPAEIDELEFG